jgi:alanine-synthesizing transaminase
MSRTSPSPSFSRRLPWEEPQNRLAAAVGERRRLGLPILDPTESNPTRVGLAYPVEELGELLRSAAAADYRPDPLGLPAAREALAAAFSLPGDPVSPADLVLTASTSEAYGFLLKAFTDPGDEVLAAVPSYPLLDHLAALEGARLVHFPLARGRRFAFDSEAAAAAAGRAAKALLLVHPNNPTGAFLRREEQRAALALCATRGLALVSDEVFADYPLAGDPERAGAAAAQSETLAFSLGGLSKSAGLPHWKLAWIRVGGPAAERRRAVAALELVADSYLSVGTPVQHTLPGLLALAPRIRGAIRERLVENLATLAAALGHLPAVELLPPEGGWTAVLRVPRLMADEELALDLLERQGVLLHPGFFFDFPTEGYLVVSLLPSPDIFREAVARLAGYLSELIDPEAETARPRRPPAAAILPAAGASRRMGRPKPLLPFRGGTVAGGVVAALRGAGIDRIALVTAPADEPLRGWAETAALLPATNPDPSRGMLSSILEGLAALGGPAALAERGETLLVCPADLPALRPSTVTAVLGAVAAGARLAVPVHEGRRGHPLAIAPSLLGELPTLDPAVGLRQLLDRHAESLREIEVDDPGAVADLDTPEAYERLTGTTAG